MLVSEGFYHSFSELAKLSNKTWIVLPSSQADNYGWKAEDVEELFRTNPDIVSDLACVVIIDPGNPTGSVIPPNEKSALAKVFTLNNILILEDMIYSGIVLGEDQSRIKNEPMLNFHPHTIQISGAGKLFSVPGIRCAFVMSMPSILRDAYNPYCAPKSFPDMVAVAQLLVFLELTPSNYFLESNQIYTSRIQLATEKIEMINRRLGPIIQRNTPKGGFFLLLKLPQLKGRLCLIKNQTRVLTESLDLCEYFLHFKSAGKPLGVKMAPTSSTGIPADRMELRASFGNIEEREIHEAFERIELALTALKNFKRSELLHKSSKL